MYISLNTMCTSFPGIISPTKFSKKAVDVDRFDYFC